MKDLLKEAFTRACEGIETIHQTINHACDLAGFYIWRAMMDDTFLSVDHTRFEPGPFRRVAKGYDWLRDKAQGYLYKDMLDKGATGNVGPKPNYKPVLAKAFETAAPHIVTRLNAASPVMAAFTIAAVAVTAYAFSQSGSTHVMPDMVATWYGANAQGQVSGVTTDEATKPYALPSIS